ncbi:MAG: hypothetical protein AAGA05_15630 [Pseudomonadota bacterium]
MSKLKVEKLRLRNGVWEGVVTGASGTGAAPAIRVTLQDQPLDGVELIEYADEGHWLLTVPVPDHAICDGVQTFLIRDAGTDQTLSHFSLIAGDALDDDLRAEVELLRAELDMLKRAFRRHCLETM